MIDLLVTLAFYFLPVWIASSWYFIPAFRRAIGVFIAVIMVGVVAASFIPSLGVNFGVYGVFGHYNLVWPILFWISVAVLKYKKYEFTQSCFISFLAAVLATEVWEIPIHFLTVKMTPTFEQFAITFMLSSCYLILVVPLIHEARKLKWRVVKPMYFCAPLLFAFSCGVVATSQSYPPFATQMTLRILSAVFFIVFAAGFPRLGVG